MPRGESHRFPNTRGRALIPPAVDSPSHDPIVNPQVIVKNPRPPHCYVFADGR